MHHLCMEFNEASLIAMKQIMTGTRGEERRGGGGRRGEERGEGRAIQQEERGEERRGWEGRDILYSFMRRKNRL